MYSEEISAFFRESVDLDRLVVVGRSNVKKSTHTLRYRIFRRKLVKARKEADLTQAEAADKLDEHQSFVSKSESGERRVDIVELAEFAKIYDKPITYFLGEENLAGRKGK